jgi:hypothetical protein
MERIEELRGRARPACFAERGCGETLDQCRRPGGTKVGSAGMHPIDIGNARR